MIDGRRAVLVVGATLKTLERNAMARSNTATGFPNIIIPIINFQYSIIVSKTIQ